jgi:hypothetical protein
VSPQDEVTEWCTAVLGHMRANRSLLRTAMGELEERPETALSMCEGPNCAAMTLTDYVLTLQAGGVVSRDADIRTAVSMLMSALFGDALCRDVMRDAFPEPAEQAPALYVRAFLATLGVNVGARTARAGPGRKARAS